MGSVANAVISATRRDFGFSVVAMAQSFRVHPPIGTGHDDDPCHVQRRSDYDRQPLRSRPWSGRSCMRFNGGDPGAVGATDQGRCVTAGERS